MDDSGAYLEVSLVDGSTTSLGFSADGQPDVTGYVAVPARVSPDGSHIAYLKGGDLHVRGIDGSGDKDFGPATDFAWRPDSGALAVFSGHLAVVNAGSGVVTVVCSYNGSKPSWSPDGSRIAFIRSTGGIYVVGASGGTVKAMPGTSKATYVQWQP